MVIVSSMAVAETDTQVLDSEEQTRQDKSYRLLYCPICFKHMKEFVFILIFGLSKDKLYINSAELQKVERIIMTDARTQSFMKQLGR